MNDLHELDQEVIGDQETGSKGFSVSLVIGLCIIFFAFGAFVALLLAPEDPVQPELTTGQAQVELLLEFGGEAFASPTQEPRILGLDPVPCDMLEYESGGAWIECFGLPELADFVGYTGLLDVPQEKIQFSVDFSGEGIPNGCLVWIEKAMDSRETYLRAECAIQDEIDSTADLVYLSYEIPIGGALLSREATPVPTATETS